MCVGIACRPVTHNPLQTTLMDVLAGRKTVGTITGDIRLNGKEPPAFHSVYRHPMLARLGGEGKTRQGVANLHMPHTCFIHLQATPSSMPPLHACPAIASRRVRSSKGL